jgi:hypothetical protein
VSPSLDGQQRRVGEELIDDDDPLIPRGGVELGADDEDRIGGR